MESKTRTWLATQRKEAAGLFESLIESVKAEFLHNSDHGLDAYLSMRVRHGSLAGHLRGPLEKLCLIVSRNDDKYIDNAALATELAIEEEDRKSLFACFADFSRRYDGIIDDLIKNRLQIRTIKKPDGMFGWPVDHMSTATNIIRRQVKSDTTFEEFMLLLTATALTFVLHQVSHHVRDFILVDVKAKVETSFEELRHALGTFDILPRIRAG